MEKQLIIINHVGTSVLEAVEKELYQLVDDVKAFSKGEVVLAFNSKRAIKKLSDKGIHIIHMDEALENAHRRIQSDKLSVQLMPTHIVGGTDYVALREKVKNFEGHMEVLLPLLASVDDCKKLTRALKDILIHHPDQPVLFVGHGTKDPSNRFYDVLIEEYRLVNDKCRFMTLDDEIPKIEEDQLILFPLFTVSGYHVRKDLVDAQASIKNRLIEEGKAVEVMENGLLSYQGIRQLYLDRLK